MDILAPRFWAETRSAQKMRAALNEVMAPRKLALAGAKFRAWWDGADFDQAAFDAEHPIEEAKSIEEAVAEALFDKPEGDARLEALELLWGQGRLSPGDEYEEGAMLDTLGVAANATLAVMGPHGMTPLANLTAAHKGAVKVFEWRVAVLDLLTEAREKKKLRNKTDVVAFDLDNGALPSDHFAGLVSFDEFSYVDHAPNLAAKIAKTLKRGGRAVIDAYVGDPSVDYSAGFAASFGAPHIQSIEGLRSALIDAKLEITHEEDLTEQHDKRVRARFFALRESMGGAEWTPPPVRVAQELEWELESWKARLRFLANRRLERRRLTVRR